MSTTPIVPTAILNLQGAVNVAFGLYGLVRPADWRAQITTKFGGSVPTAVAYTLSLQLLNTGVFTCFAASRPSLHRRALIARVAVHLLTAYLFFSLHTTTDGGDDADLRSLALADLGFAVLNLLAFPFCA